VFWCGIAFNHYGSYSLSAYTTLTSRQLFRTAAFVCETCVFIYIGISLPTFDYRFDFRLILWSVVACFLGRALHVFPLSFLLNLKKKKKLSWQIQVAIWFAGLRGAMAFSLAMSTESPNAKYMQTTTLIVVHFTLFVMGSGTLPLLKFLKIKTSSSDQSLDNITKQRQKTVQPRSKNRAASIVSDLDEKYLKYWFRRPVQPLAREAVELFEKLASNTGAEEGKSETDISEAELESDGELDYKKVNDEDGNDGEEVNGKEMTEYIKIEVENHDNENGDEHGDNGNDNEIISDEIALLSQK